MAHSINFVAMGQNPAGRCFCAWPKPGSNVSRKSMSKHRRIDARRSPLLRRRRRIPRRRNNPSDMTDETDKVGRQSVAAALPVAILLLSALAFLAGCKSELPINRQKASYLHFDDDSVTFLEWVKGIVFHI